MLFKLIAIQSFYARIIPTNAIFSIGLFFKIFRALFSSEICLRKEVPPICLEWRFLWWKHDEKQEREITAEYEMVSKSHLCLCSRSQENWWDQLAWDWLHYKLLPSCEETHFTVAGTGSLNMATRSKQLQDPNSNIIAYTKLGSTIPEWSYGSQTESMHDPKP